MEKKVIKYRLIRFSGALPVIAIMRPSMQTVSPAALTAKLIVSIVSSESIMAFHILRFNLPVQYTKEYGEKQRCSFRCVQFFLLRS